MTVHVIDRAAHPVRSLHRRQSLRWHVLAPVLVMLAALVGSGTGLIAYGFVTAASDYLAADAPLAPCHTPTSRFGWRYEAVNYDRADDARLLAAAKDPGACVSQGSGPRIDVRSRDGTLLAGWYVPGIAAGGPTGPTVVLVHARGANKSSMLEYAPALHHDFNLLIPDLRHSGRSGGRESTGGLLERDDLRAMIDWLGRTKRPAWIAALGTSTGAVAALAEAASDGRVRALILDSMQASIESRLAADIRDVARLPEWPTTAAMLAGIAVRVGQDPASIDPDRLFGEVPGRPILLTHGSGDVVNPPAESLEPNVRAARAAGIDLEVRVCPGAAHGRVAEACAGDWSAWVTAFLDRARVTSTAGSAF